MAERGAATRVVQRTVPAGSTLGADMGYDTQEFVQAMRKLKVMPHVVANKPARLPALSPRRTL